MSLFLLAVCGAGAGTGVALALLILYPARPALAEALTAPNRPPAPPRPTPGSAIQKAGFPVGAENLCDVPVFVQ